MESEWRSSTWGDEVSLEYGKAIRGYSQTVGKYRVYGSNGPIGWTCDALTNGPGVILGRKGAYRGTEFCREPFWVIDTAYYLVPKTPLDMRWLYYAVKHYKLGEVDDGSPIPSTTRAAVYMLDLDVPPESEQRAIAHILGTLDDKIELNRLRNRTLEAIAHALFQDWFVDFGPVRAKMEGCEPYLPPDLWPLFPDCLDNEGKPEGWDIKTVEDLSLKVGMGPFGSNIKVSTFVEQGIPIISGQHLNSAMLEDNTFRFITNEHADKLSSANVGRGDVVFTHAGNIGQVSYIPDQSRYERYILSQRQFYLRCDLSKISPLFMTYFFRSSSGQHKLLANASQVGVPSIARPVSYLKSIEIVAPPKGLSDKFDKKVRLFHCQISASSAEIDRLINLRDTLLPKLISGEVRIADAERFLEKAGI